MYPGIHDSAARFSFSSSSILTMLSGDLFDTLVVDNESRCAMTCIGRGLMASFIRSQNAASGRRRSALNWFPRNQPDGCRRDDLGRDNTPSSVAIRMMISAIFSAVILCGDRVDHSATAAEASALEKSISIRCVDADGKPVSQAEIYLFQHDYEKSRYLQFGPFTSDASGAAVCEQVLVDRKTGNYDRWFYARVPDRLVGTARSTRWTGRTPSNTDGIITLQPSTSIDGEVTVPPSFNVAKVRVQIREMHVMTGPAPFNYESFPRQDSFPGLNTALSEIFESHPDATGKVRFRDLPRNGRLYLVATCDGLAEGQWMNVDNKLTQSISLPMEVESSLSGRVLAPDGTPAAGVAVRARISSIQKSQRRTPYLSTFSTVTNEAGEYSLRGLPQLELVVSVNDPQERWIVRPVEDLLLNVDENRMLSLTAEAGVNVSGRVTDGDGKPVAAAHMSALTDTHVGSGVANASTDADGLYHLRLPSGKSRLYFNSLPTGFAYPDPQIIKQFDIQPDQPEIKHLNFVLQREPTEAKSSNDN